MHGWCCSPMLAVYWPAVTLLKFLISVGTVWHWSSTGQKNSSRGKAHHWLHVCVLNSLFAIQVRLLTTISTYVIKAAIKSNLSQSVKLVVRKLDYVLEDSDLNLNLSHVGHKSFLNDFGPVTHTEPYPSHRVVVRIEGQERKNLSFVSCLGICFSMGI